MPSLKIVQQKVKINKGHASACPYKVVQINLNQYTKIVFISKERFKNKFIRLFAVSSLKKVGSFSKGTKW